MSNEKPTCGDQGYGCRGYLEGRKITPEEIEDAAEEFLAQTFVRDPHDNAGSFEWERARRIVTKTFRAAGLSVEAAS